MITPFYKRNDYIPLSRNWWNNVLDGVDDQTDIITYHDTKTAYIEKRLELFDFSIINNGTPLSYLSATELTQFMRNAMTDIFSGIWRGQYDSFETIAQLNNRYPNDKCYSFFIAEFFSFSIAPEGRKYWLDVVEKVGHD